MSTRILLAEDHSVMRQGLRSLLEREAGWTVVAEAADGRTAVQLAATTAPDVAVLDIGLPGLNGIEAARQITALQSGIRVVALSMHSHRRYVVEMLRAGASAYVLKEAAYEEVVRAIREVLQGRLYLCTQLATDYIREVISRDEAGAGADAFRLLSAREREVLQLIAEGRSTKEIGADLGVSVKTVETFRQNLMRKLGLDSVADLTKYAIREGLTQADP